MVIISLLIPHCDCHPLSIKTTLWLPYVLSWYHIVIIIHSLLKPHSDCHMFSPDTTMWSPSNLCWYHIVTAICFSSLLIPHHDRHSLSLETTLSLPSALSWHHTVITIHSSLKPYCDCHLFPLDIKLLWPYALLGSILWISSVLWWYHPEIVIYSLLIPHCNDYLLSVDTTLCSHLLSLIPHCNSCLPCWYNSVMTSAIYTNEHYQNPCAMWNFQQQAFNKQRQLWKERKLPVDLAPSISLQQLTQLLNSVSQSVVKTLILTLLMKTDTTLSGLSWSGDAGLPTNFSPSPRSKLWAKQGISIICSIFDFSSWDIFGLGKCSTKRKKAERFHSTV